MITDRSQQHLLSSLGAVGLGVVLPCLLPAGVIGAAAGAVGGLAGNLLANQVQKFLDRRENDPSLPDRNHDLLRLMGNAVAHEIGEFARAHASALGEQAALVHTLAGRAAEPFVALFEEGELPDIAPPDARALLAASARGDGIPPAGTQEDWETVVQRLASRAGVTLAPDVERQLAAQLHAHVWESIRKALKNDFAHDGKGYAALHLQFMADVMARLDELIEAPRPDAEQAALSRDLLEELRQRKQAEADPKAGRIIEQLRPADRNRLSKLIERHDHLSAKLDRGLRQVVGEVRAADRASRSRDAVTHRRLRWLAIAGAAAVACGLLGFISVRFSQSRQLAATTQVADHVGRVELKLDDTAGSLDAFRIEATALLNRYLAANAELSRTLTDREAEIDRIASALREAQAAADQGDKLAEQALAEVRKTGDLRLLQETLARIADEQYAKAQQTFAERQARYVERCREIATIAYLRGDISVAEYRVGEILKIHPDDLDATNRLGRIYSLRGDNPSAERQYQRLMELAPEDQLWRAVALGNLGLIAQTRGDLDAAEKLLREALEINRKLGRLEGQATQLGNLGGIAQTRGDLDAAEKLHREALEIDRKLGRLEGQANQLGNLGLIAQTRGDLDAAEDLLREALEINRKLDRLEGQANQLGNLGLIAFTRGELDAAEKLHHEALEIDRKLGRLEAQASELGNLGLIAGVRGDLDAAEKLHREALEINRKVGRLEGQANQLGNLGGIAEQRGDFAEARRRWTESRDLFARAGMPHRVETVEGWLDGLPPE